MDLASDRRPPMPRLTCEKCAQRKVRCDKLNPCSNCLRAGVLCVAVERQRLPRGRRRARSGSITVDSDVRDRLARLESLVRGLVPDSSATASAQSLGGRNRPSLEEPPDDTASNTKNLGVGSSNLDDATVTGPYMGNPFWSHLIQETRGLREVLERVTDDGNDGPGTGQAAEIHSQLLGFPSPSARPASFVESLEQSAAPQIREKLCQIFFHQVDPVFKILHRPSLTAHIAHGERYLNYELDHPTVEALDYSVYYAAAASLTEDQCTSIFGASKSTIVSKYRLASEAALAYTDFVMTDDLTVLQAFVLYLIATRSHDCSRRVWTMLSLAVRISQGLFLHTEHPSAPAMRPFERELRRRLWYAIGLLDMQAALERASEPMIPGEWLQTSNFPMEIDDAEIWLDFAGELTGSEGFNDMTFTMMTCKAQCVGRLLNFPSLSGTTVNDWYVRQNHVHDFQRDMFSLLQRGSSETESAPFYWYAEKIAELLTATTQLIAVRPLRQQSCESPPQVKGSSILKLAVNVIRKSQALVQDPLSVPWRWFDSIFAPWHALAVALAEICVCDDAALLASCWAPVDVAFARLSGQVDVSSRSALWGPMEKLMKQAREKMKSNIAFCGSSSNPHDASLSSPGPSILANFQPIDVRLTSPPMFSKDASDWTLSPGLPSEGHDTWPDLGEAMNLLSATSPSLADIAAWASWENFVNDFYVGGDSVFSFG